MASFSVDKLPVSDEFDYWIVRCTNGERRIVSAPPDDVGQAEKEIAEFVLDVSWKRDKEFSQEERAAALGLAQKLISETN